MPDSSSADDDNGLPTSAELRRMEAEGELRMEPVSYRRRVWPAVAIAVALPLALVTIYFLVR